MSLCEISSVHIKAAALLHKTAFEKAWTEKEFQGLLSLPTTKGWIDEGSLLLISHVLDEIEILTILTHPDFRKMGKAKTLLSLLFDYAKENNAHQIFLEVNVENKPAIALYEKMGFQKTGVRKNYYKMKDGSFCDAHLYTLLTNI